MLNLSELNEEQKAVVTQGDGYFLVLAGAGSGKTRTIVYRAAYLLEQGVAPENILLVTFTNKAAAEMISRVGELSSRAGLTDCHSRESGNPETTEREKIPKQVRDDTVQDDEHVDPRFHGDDRKKSASEPSSVVRSPKAVLPWAGTFHHIAYKILRRYSGALGYAPNFTILDADDSEALVKTCVKQLAPETGGQKFPSAGVLKAVISYARNAETTIEDVLDMKYPGWLKWSEEIKQIAAEYEKRKRAANSMDFDDLLVNLLLLLNSSVILNGKNVILSEAKDLSSDEKDSSVVSLPQNDNPVLKKYATQFKHILVDEYQDTNRLQASIVKKMASVHKNLLVVGDDAQSIYSFRAAEIENILNFEKDFPGAKIFKLETNYRSSQEILSLANAVIANNVKQYPKNLKTIFQSGLKPQLRPRADQSAEAEFVVEKITEFLEQGVPAKEIAVLFRAAHHSQQLEMALAQAGIAYDYRGGARFFERAHVKDILAYLRLLNNPADESAWSRVLLKEEGIGPAAVKAIVENVQDCHSRESGNPETTEREKIPKQVRDDTVQDDEHVDPRLRGDDIKHLGDCLSGKAQVGWNNFLKTYNAALESGGSPAKAVRAILETGYADYLEAEYFDSRERKGDLEQLVIYAGKFSDLAEFLAEASLAENYRQVTSPPPSPYKGEGDGAGHPLLTKERKEVRSGKIILSTVHQAKGLEWSAVFVVNLSSGAFPNSRAANERGGIEEERRLFYVAITRAKKHLFLTYPMENSGWGDTLPGPSMFLEEIDSELLDDKSLLKSGRALLLNDPSADVEYVSEENDRPLKIRPGSFLRDVEDL